MTRSLKSRLQFGMAIGSTAVLLVSALVLHWLVRETLVAEFDASLTAEAHRLSDLVEIEGNVVVWEHDEESSRFDGQQRPDYFQMWDRTGKVIGRSGGLSFGNLQRSAGSFADPEFRFVTLPNGHAGRTIGVTFTPQHEPHDEDDSDEVRLPTDDSPAFSSHLPLSLVIARDTASMDRTLDRLTVLLIAVFGCTFFVTVLITAPIVRAAMLPLKTTAQRIESLGGSTLTSRVDATDAPQEVQSVIDCLNRLLGRLDDAFQRERAFSQNVAHELRTPIAGLRSLLEVALLQPRQRDEQDRTMRQCLEITNETQTVVENLLTLARIDAGQSDVQREAVQIGTLLRNLWTAFSSRAEVRSLTVRLRINDDLRVETDPAILRMILHNLLDNAVAYVDEEGTIELETLVADGKTTIEITNSGSRLTAAQAANVFERFWRGDAARRETGKHAGLGLPLCQQLCELLGAAISVTSQPGGDFRVCLTLPAA